MWASLRVAVFLVLPIRGAAPDEFVGAARCAGCHPAQSAAQAKTGHAQSLSPAGKHRLAGAITRPLVHQRDPAFRFRFRQLGEQMRVSGYDADNVMDIPVEWAFGAGDQAVTLVTRIDRDWHLEHYLSYYSALGGMAPTAGHGALAPKTLPEAMGLPYKTSDPQTGILGCFECHSTGPVRNSAEGVLTPHENGVRCESCHGPGLAHVRAAEQGQAARARTAIRNPRQLTSIGQMTECGRCHRPPAGERTKIDWNYVWNVRHQPVYLSQSKCMTESDGRLSCLSCHDPHTALRRNDVAYYRDRCLQCHQRQSAAPVLSCRRKESGADCVSCHMPSVSPQPALHFRNHWIGVYPPGQPLRPRQ